MTQTLRPFILPEKCCLMSKLRGALGAAQIYAWPTAAVTAATGCFWLLRHAVDKGQASLLYLPVVLVLAVHFGFGPAIFGAVLSFLCWDFFFLPPFDTLTVSDPKDWLSLGIFLLAAVVTAQLAAQARSQTQQAHAREAEISTLFEASETLSREVRADRLLATLSDQLRTLCRATLCLVFRREEGALLSLVAGSQSPAPNEEDMSRILHLAEAACAGNLVIGFGSSRHLWVKALSEIEPPLSAHSIAGIGVSVPLRAGNALVGALYVGPRDDGKPYSALEERLILTLSNHAAVVIARDLLAERAAQAGALREADTLKEALLSLVSHELRTPLAAIKASASGLLQPGSHWEETDRRDALQAIDTEADRLSSLVSNLLDLSRLEAGAWHPRKDWCDMAEVIGTALDRLPPSDAARVEMHLAPDVPFIQADYTQIALVVSNLLENAVKYTPSGSPIYLSLAPNRPQAASLLGVTLRVRDFGAGLLSGETECLFERFYRGRRHLAVHGTGLGLALCQAIVQAHAGRLWAANAPADEAAGAVFSVFLPVVSP